jgi:parallel beta-helix repeat protein
MGTVRRQRVLLAGVLLVSGAATATLLFGAVSGNAAPRRHTVSCGDTITSSVTLTSDLSCPGADGLKVGADNVTINLNGHTIRGDGSPGVSGVYNAGFDHVTIENGAVANYFDGIVIWSKSSTDRALYNVVKGVTVTGAVDMGIQLNGAPNCRVVGNSVFRTKSGSNIFVWNHSDRCLISDNTVVKTSFYGIAVASSRGVRVLRNLVASGRSSGIVVGGQRYKISQNKVFGNRGPGILFSGGNNNTFSKNTVSGNGAGLLIGRGAGTVVDGNTVTGNAGIGIKVRSKQGTYQVTGNVAGGNGKSGIVNFAGGTTIGGNTANGNGVWGIWSVPGSADGGGNSAKLNAKFPFECVNVSCS